MPAYMIATAILRDCGFTDSADSAIRLGIAPPKPTPVRKRASNSVW